MGSTLRQARTAAKRACRPPSREASTTKVREGPPRERTTDGRLKRIHQTADALIGAGRGPRRRTMRPPFMHVTAERHLPVRAALRGRAVVMAVLGLLVVLGVLAFFIVFSQQQSKTRINANFGMRAASSATVVSTYLTQQAAREEQDALEFLAARHVSTQRF